MEDRCVREDVPEKAGECCFAARRAARYPDYESLAVIRHFEIVVGGTMICKSEKGERADESY